MDTRGPALKFSPLQETVLPDPPIPDRADPLCIPHVSRLQILLAFTLPTLPEQKMATSGLCSANSFFAERDAVLEDVAGMISTADASAAAILGTRVATVLDRYQEQPHLLDPSLPAIVGPLMQKCRELLRLSVEKEDGVSGRAFPLQVQQGAAYLQCLFSVVYRCCKVRGYKAILRHFPHEVADLEPVFNCLLSQVSLPSRRQVCRPA